MISATVEFDLVRLTAQSSGPNPKEPGGGAPAYSRQEILACLGEVPHLAFHCLLAKYCDEEPSIYEVLRSTAMMSLQEWFTNPEHATKKIEAGSLKKVSELAVLGWLNPHIKQSESNEARAAYMGIPTPTWRAKYQSHYSWLLGELGYYQNLGESVYLSRKYGRRDGMITVTECPTCGSRKRA